MSRIRTIGLALAAVFAFSAISAAAASAAELEWTVHPDKIVKATAGAGELDTVGGRDVKCKAGSTTGEIEKAILTIAKAIKYTGCESTKFGAGKCQTKGFKEKGEIITNELEGELVYPAKTKGKHEKAAVAFKPKGGGNFATFECETLIGAETLTVAGTAVCEVLPINLLQLTGEIVCKMTAAKSGKSSISEYENEAGVVTKGAVTLTEGKGPENFAFEESAVESKTAIEFELEENTKA